MLREKEINTRRHPLEIWAGGFHWFPKTNNITRVLFQGGKYSVTIGMGGLWIWRLYRVITMSTKCKNSEFWSAHACVESGRCSSHCGSAFCILGRLEGRGYELTGKLWMARAQPPLSGAHLRLFWRDKKVSEQEFRRPHDNHLTSINVDIEHPDDGNGNVLIA